MEEGCLAEAEAGPPSSIKESKVKFFLVCYYLSGYSYTLEILVFYCIFFFLATVLTGIKSTAPLYREASTLCKQWKRMPAFSSLPWERVPPIVLPLSWVGTAHIWITGSFLPGAILDCYSLEASHAVTGTNWFNHQLLWSLKLLKVPAKLMNCDWMWTECLSLFPTTSYQRLLYPCKVKGRRFRLWFNNGLCPRTEPHSLRHSQLQFAFHTLLYEICIQLIHWIIGILWVSKESLNDLSLRYMESEAAAGSGLDNEAIPRFSNACKWTHFPSGTPEMAS